MSQHHVINVALGAFIVLVNFAAAWDSHHIRSAWRRTAFRLLVLLGMAYGIHLLILWGVPGLEP